MILLRNHLGQETGQPLWGIMRAQWDHRNADRHGRTKEANHEIRHAQLLHQLTEQYAEAPAMLAADRNLLAEPIKAKQKKIPAALELWMKRVRPIVKLSRHDATEAIKRTHKQITQFFSRQDTEQTTNNEKDPEKPGPV
jgi:hypothetical protein